MKTMMFENDKNKQDLLKRMRRIEGQTRGVQAMIEDNRECGEILQQLTALQSAVKSASLFLLKQYAVTCVGNLEDDNSEQKREELLDNLLTLIGKAS
jgi:DNA-binding FrmR family transcriptional regulator